MNINDVLKLTEAGFTKDDIMAMISPETSVEASEEATNEATVEAINEESTEPKTEESTSHSDELAEVKKQIEALQNALIKKNINEKSIPETRNTDIVLESLLKTLK